MFTRLRIILTLIILTSACQSASLVGGIDPTTTPIATATPTVTMDMPTDTALPTDTPTVTPSPTVVPSPTPAFDATIYHPALLPEFQADAARVLAEGATEYQINLDIASDALDPNSEQPINLTGTLAARYTNTEDVPLDRLVLRLYPYLSSYGGQVTFNDIRLAGQSVEPLPSTEPTVLEVPFAEPLSPDATVTLALAFVVEVPRRVESGYNLFSYDQGTLALAGFYPTIAVYDAQGWNRLVPPPYGDASYHDIAFYQVQVTAPAELVLVGSGKVVERTTLADQRQQVRWVAGPMRDFYLVLSSEYATVSETIDGVTVNSYHRPEHGEAGISALRYAVDALRLFNARIGPYPYTELDIVGTPTRAGGIEYPGIIVVADGLYAEPRGRFFEHATVHEVAHQWWYAMVGNNQITEPWLDEALTNYTSYLYWEATYGEEVGQAVLEGFSLAPYHALQERGIDRPVAGPVESFDSGSYGAVVYGKGPLFFHALHNELGTICSMPVCKPIFRTSAIGLPQQTI